MRLICSALAVLWLGLSPAMAGACLENEAALAALGYAFGNTVRISGGGETVDIYFECDGTFSARSSVNGEQFGRWRVDGARLCTRATGAEESCGPIQDGRGAGDQWEQNLDGTTLTVEVIPGR